MMESVEQGMRRAMKTELRKRMRALRKTLPSDACAERSKRIVAYLRNHPWLQSARMVALFWPMLERHEVDLRELDPLLRARGTRIAYPAMIQKEDAEMTFREVSDPEALSDAGFGFKEPPADATEATDLDVIIVPALAVAPSGHRIGYGAGHYDRALARHPKARTIAVAYDFQLLIEVPFTEGDRAVDFIVTDARSTPREEAMGG